MVTSKITVIGICKAAAYGVSLVFMIACAAGTSALYSSGEGGLTINCGVFKFEACVFGSCITDFSCDAFNSTRYAVIAMWASAVFFILAGLAMAFMAFFAKVSSTFTKMGSIAVDVAATLCLATLVGLVAVQPKTEWCDADFSSYDLSFRYGFYLIIITMVLSIASCIMSCVSWCLPAPQTAGATDDQTSNHYSPKEDMYPHTRRTYPPHGHMYPQPSPPRGQVTNPLEEYPQVNDRMQQQPSCPPYEYQGKQQYQDTEYTSEDESLASASSP